MPLQLTDAQLDWLRANYPFRENAEIERKLRMSRSQLERLSLRMGFKKDAEYITHIRRRAVNLRWKKRKRVRQKKYIKKSKKD